MFRCRKAKPLHIRRVWICGGCLCILWFCIFSTTMYWRSMPYQEFGSLVLTSYVFRRKKRGYPIEELRMLAFCVYFNLVILPILQIWQVELVGYIHCLLLLQKHQHIDWHIHHLVINSYITITKHQSLWKSIFCWWHDIRQSIMTFIILTRLYLYRLME